MKTVALQFSRPDAAAEGLMDRAISAAICKRTCSEICHVDIMLPDGSLVGAHAGDGIKVRPAGYEAWGLRIRVSLDVPDAKAEALFSYAESMVGTAYDLKDILGIALGDSRLHHDGQMICSWFAAVASDEKSRIVRVAKVPWLVNPDELRLVWASQPGAVEQRIEGR
jgi:hypothetical protein